MRCGFCGFELRHSLVRQILYLLLQRITLVGRGFRQICFCLSRLPQSGNPRLEMLLHPLELLFLFFLFIRLLPMISIFEVRTLLPQAKIKEEQP